MKKYLVLALLLACVQMPCLASPPRDTLISQGPVQITSVVWTSYGNVIVEYRVGAISYKRISSWSNFTFGWYNEIYKGVFAPRHIDTIPDTILWKDISK